jgi:hypothetical protein
MINGQCIKCQSQSVLMSEGGGGISNDINLRIRKGNQYPATGNWVTYLCTHCGYFENYFKDADLLAKIASDPARNGWRRVVAK